MVVVVAALTFGMLATEAEIKSADVIRIKAKTLMFFVDLFIESPNFFVCFIYVKVNIKFSKRSLDSKD